MDRKTATRCGLRCLLALLVLAPVGAAAQQITTGTPFQSTSGSFFENFGTQFGFHVGGAQHLPFDDGGSSAAFGITSVGTPTAGGAIQVNQGGFGGGPAFGGFAPGSQTTGGVGFGGSGFGGNLGFSMGQGSRRSLVSQTPMVTTMNGQGGMISDQVQMPFVTSVTPIVNGFAAGPVNPYSVLRRASGVGGTSSPIVDRYRRSRQETDRPRSRSARSAALGTASSNSFRQQLDLASASTAGQAATSVAEIERQRNALDSEANREAEATYRRAVAAEESGKLGIAKIYYRMAAREATGSLQQQAKARLAALLQRRDTKRSRSEPSR